jgi:hypothetical protein
MNQQTARLALRAFILISAFLTMVYLAVSLADDSLLPKELAEWKAAQETEEDAAAAIVGLVLVMPLIAALIASMVGLFMFKKWGAWLYLGVSLLGALFMLIEPNVESGVAAFFSDLDTLAGGIILGIAFFSNALEPDQAS